MSGRGTPRIAALVHRIGPYHDARFRALARRADVVVVEYSAVDDTYAWDRVSVDGYRVERLFVDADVATQPAREVRTRMRMALAASAPEVVAIPGWSDRASLAALDWCRRTGTPTVVMSETNRHDARRGRWKEWVKSRIVRQFDAALVGGTPHAEYAVALGQPRERVFRGYDVVDNAYFARAGDAAKEDAPRVRERYRLPERYFLASSRFIPKKNLERLLAAYGRYAARAAPDPWHLVLLGDGELRGAIEARVAAAGLRARVHLPGFVQYGDLPAYYGLASAFVHASTVEQWGLVVNEAMAAGLPVLVSSRCGCSADLVRPEVNGFRFDPFDVDALAARMAQLAGDEYDLGAMGRASREIIAGFGPDSFAENLTAAAHAALAAPARRAAPLDHALAWMAARR
ncbi:MAG TPA: glycosyltransferase [Usitatibacter sp.]|jgi:glycosyltransferase involved in cell wall biosynthesis|nr:glycosyltransferase [Usitatibacter sp.]